MYQVNKNLHHLFLQLFLGMVHLLHLHLHRRHLVMVLQFRFVLVVGLLVVCFQFLLCWNQWLLHLIHHLNR